MSALPLKALKQAAAYTPATPELRPTQTPTVVNTDAPFPWLIFAAVGLAGVLLLRGRS